MAKRVRPVTPSDRPWFKVFAAETLLDDKISTYSADEIGCALILWCQMWVTKDIRLNIDLAKKILAARTNVDPDAIIEKLSSNGLGILEIDREDDIDYLTSTRLKEQQETIEWKIIQNRKKGALGGRPPGKGKKPKGKAKQNQKGNPNETHREGEGEGEGEGDKKETKRRTRIDLNFSPNDKQIQYAIDHGVAKHHIKNFTQSFIDHYYSHGKRMLDWNACWQTFCRNAIEFSKQYIDPNWLKRRQTDEAGRRFSDFVKGH